MSQGLVVAGVPLAARTVRPALLETVFRVTRWTVLALPPSHPDSTRYR